MEMTGAKCPHCNDIVYSRSRHDFMECNCGKSFIDGGFDYTRIGGNPMPYLVKFELNATHRDISNSVGMETDKRRKRIPYNGHYQGPHELIVPKKPDGDVAQSAEQDSHKVKDAGSNPVVTTNPYYVTTFLCEQGTLIRETDMKDELNRLHGHGYDLIQMIPRINGNITAILKKRD